MNSEVLSMSNFLPFQSDPRMEPFVSVAIAAERILPIDPSACALNCRRAMEIAVKWMYAVDGSLVMPWDDKLVSLISTEEFRGIVDEKLLFRLDFIRRIGNTAAHGGNWTYIAKDLEQTRVAIAHGTPFPQENAGSLGLHQ